MCHTCATHLSDARKIDPSDIIFINFVDIDKRFSSRRVYN